MLASGTVFACPSVYEPLGIVNLEAMAVGLPVVGTATGGIPEVVDDGVTGELVPIDQAQDGTGTPLDPERFVGDLAAALTRVTSRPRAGRRDGGRRAVAGSRTTSRGTPSPTGRSRSTGPSSAEPRRGGPAGVDGVRPAGRTRTGTGRMRGRRSTGGRARR